MAEKEKSLAENFEKKACEKEKEEALITPVWKNIYNIITGANSSINDEIVQQILKLCSEQQAKLLLTYKPYTKESYDAWVKKKVLKEFKNKEMKKFIHKLSIDLDLQTDIAWEVLCNYFMFEYFGKVQDLIEIVKFTVEANILIENIWNFYTNERMYLLKIFRHILEKLSDKEYLFNKEYQEFFNVLDLNHIWKDVLQIFKNLIQEIDKDKADKCFCKNEWVHRNNREQIEILLIMTHLINHIKIDGTELTKIIDLFLLNSFNRYPIYFESNSISLKEDITEIKCAEVGVIFAISNKYFENPKIVKLLSEEVEKRIERLPMQGEHTVILFIWSILKTALIESKETLDYCNQILLKLLDSDIFFTTYKAVSNKIFKNCLAGNYVVAGLNRLLKEFTKICADYKYLYCQKGVIELVALSLEKSDKEARLVFNELIKISIDTFPHDFEPLMQICHALLPCENSVDDVNKLLHNLPSFLTNLEWAFNSRDDRRLGDNENIFPGTDYFNLPKGTVFSLYNIRNKDLIQFKYVYSIFTLIDQYVSELVANVKIDEINFYRLVTAYKVLVQLIKYFPGSYQLDVDLNSCIRKLDIIPVCFFENSRFYPLIKLYFEVNSTLIMEDKMTFDEGFPVQIRKNVLPIFTKDVGYTTPMDYYYRKKFNDTPLTKSLFEETGYTDHSLCVQFVKFIHKMADKNEEEVIASGIFYILDFIFPHYLQWSYEDSLQKLIITKECLHCFASILQRRRKNLSKLLQQVYDGVLYSLLCEDVVARSFLFTFKRDKINMNSWLQRETNWIKGPVIDVLDTLKTQVVILLMLFKNKHEVLSAERFILHENVALIVRTVLSYMLHSYNNQLTILSLKFLQILAKDDDFPLLALLGLDFDQVQQLFLERLRDPLEDDTVKEQIINLISTCIYKQFGMTAAFFNLQCKKWQFEYHKTNKSSVDMAADSVGDFMIDYLQNIRKTTDFLRNPLQLGILNVMCNLWVTHKEHLVNDVIYLDQFWLLLADPLFKEFDKNCVVYTNILKIFNTQMFNYSQNKTLKSADVKSDEKEAKQKENFNKVIIKFLSDPKILKKWIQYYLSVFNRLPEEEEDIVKIRDLIKTWSEFILIVEQNLPEILKKEECRKLIIDSCLDVMYLDIGNLTVLSKLCDLCLICFSKWSLTVKNNEEQAQSIKKITHMYKVIGKYYSLIQTRTRESVITIVKIVLDNFKEFFESNSDYLLDFINEIGHIVDFEYELLEKDVLLQLKEGLYKTRQLVFPWVLVVTFCNSLLEFKNASECAVWFRYRKYWDSLIESTPKLIAHKESFPLAKVCLHSLKIYVESPLGFDKLYFDLLRFYDALEPHTNFLLSGSGNKINPFDLKEGWMICTLLIQLNRAMLAKFKARYLENCFTFFCLNNDMLCNIILLLEITVDITAMDLVTETLLFVDEVLIGWGKEWYKKANDSFNTILMSVKRLINAGISAILRPKNISFYPIDENERLTETETPVSTDFMVILVNKTIRILGLAFGCLYRVNPSLVELFDTIEPEEHYILIVNDFSVPKFDQSITYDLTYGRLLCIAHFLCKVLSTLQVKDKTNDAKKIEENLFTEHNKFAPFVGLVEYQNETDILPNQKLSAYLRTSEYSGLTDPWISELDIVEVKRTLELQMFFIGAQVMLSIMVIDACDLPYYKRNMCSELQFFNDYLKKHTTEILKNQANTTPVRVSDPFHKSEKDLFKRYFTYCHANNKYDKIIDENFLLVMSMWFSNICQLS